MPYICYLKLGVILIEFSSAYFPTNISSFQLSWKVLSIVYFGHIPSLPSYRRLSALKLYIRDFLSAEQAKLGGGHAQDWPEGSSKDTE